MTDYAQRRSARLQRLEELKKFADEATDRFGKPPKPGVDAPTTPQRSKAPAPIEAIRADGQLPSFMRAADSDGRPAKAGTERASLGRSASTLAISQPDQRRKKKTDEDQDRIIASLQQRGIDPQRMPKPPLGNKPWPLRVAVQSELKLGKDAWRKAMTVLRREGRIKHE